MTKRLAILDSLRGVAAFIVVLHHFLVFNGGEVKRGVSTWIWKILNFLSDLNVEAVLFFFVLSGFCIALAQKGTLLTDKTTANHYFYRRFKRILPIYWIALAISLLVGLMIGKATQESYSWYNLLGNMIFLQTSVYASNYWFSPYGANGPLWSLAYEMFFYLFFPVYTYLILRKPMLNSTYKQLIILSLVSLVCILANKFILYIPYLAFLSYFIVWIAGYWAAELYLIDKKRELSFGIILLLSFTILFFKRFVPSTSLYELCKGLFIASLFYWAVRFNNVWKRTAARKFITLLNKTFNYTGHGSYALYAFHYPILMAMHFYQWSLWLQLPAIIIMMWICPLLEIRLAALKILVLKRNYIQA